MVHRWGIGPHMFFTSNDEVIIRAFHHIMKPKIGADEYLNKDIREPIGLNVESASKTKIVIQHWMKSINQISEMKKKRLLSPMHPTHSITEATAAVGSQNWLLHQQTHLLTRISL